MATRLIRGDDILRVGGRTDLDLSTSGQVQASALGARFTDMGLSSETVLARPLKRALQTAAVIAGALGIADAEVDEQLREVEFGPDEGQREQAVIARIGQAALDAWEADARVPDVGRVDPAGLTQAWRAILEAASAGGGDTVAVTSNGVARFALPLARMATASH